MARKRSAERRRRHQKAIDEALKSAEPPFLERILALLVTLDASQRQQLRQLLDQLDHQSNGQEKPQKK